MMLRNDGNMIQLMKRIETIQVGEIVLNGGK